MSNKILLKCIAIDDEPPALALLKEYIDKIPSLKLLHTFNDAIAGNEYLQAGTVNLLFIDINMPDLNGLDLVRALKIKPMIIFTTAHKDFALEGFELNAIDYLLKPVSFDRFNKAINKAIDFFEYKNQPSTDKAGSLYVYSEYRMLKINVDDIEYIESLEDYIKIHLTNSKPVLTLMTLKGVLEKLPADNFRRIHRSYIVSVKKAKSIQNRKVRLISGIDLPVSESYLDFISEWKKNL
jgi:DNA-binding LytR/AlgR family response regulator